jgi:hypothetical protein
MEVVIFGIDPTSIRGISTKYGIEAEINIQVKSVDVEKKQITLLSNETLDMFDHIMVQIDAGFFNYRRVIKYNFIKKIN